MKCIFFNWVIFSIFRLIHRRRQFGANVKEFQLKHISLCLFHRCKRSQWEKAMSKPHHECRRHIVVVYGNRHDSLCLKVILCAYCATSQPAPHSRIIWCSSWTWFRSKEPTIHMLEVTRRGQNSNDIEKPLPVFEILMSLFVALINTRTVKPIK